MQMHHLLSIKPLWVLLGILAFSINTIAPVLGYPEYFVARYGQSDCRAKPVPNFRYGNHGTPKWDRCATFRQQRQHWWPAGTLDITTAIAAAAAGPCTHHLYRSAATRVLPVFTAKLSGVVVPCRPGIGFTISQWGSTLLKSSGFKAGERYNITVRQQYGVHAYKSMVLQL